MTDKTETKDEREAREKREEEKERRDKHFETKQLGDKPEVSPRLSPDQSASKQANTMEARGSLVSMYSRGFIGEAKTFFSSLDGATDAAWQSFEKMLAPIRAFVLDGTAQYPVYAETTEYAGLPVPEPEDVLEPLNETRARGEFSAAPVAREKAPEDKAKVL